MGFRILNPMEESQPRAPKKIRLTKSEAYAMRLSSPKKKRIAFGLVGLLVMAALGNVLYGGLRRLGYEVQIYRDGRTGRDRAVGIAGFREEHLKHFSKRSRQVKRFACWS